MMQLKEQSVFEWCYSLLKPFSLPFCWAVHNGYISLTGLSLQKNYFPRFLPVWPRASSRVLAALWLSEENTVLNTVFRMAVSSSLCSLRHWAKCSAVSCCSPTAEYRPPLLIHSVNKSRLVRLTCAAANRVAKTASARPMAVGRRKRGRSEALRRKRGGPKREQRENNPPFSKKTSSLLSPSFVPCCHWSWLNSLWCSYTVWPK